MVLCSADTTGMLPMIHFVQQHGNTTVYQYRTGSVPDKVSSSCHDVTDMVWCHRVCLCCRLRMPWEKSLVALLPSEIFVWGLHEQCNTCSVAALCGMLWTRPSLPPCPPLTFPHFQESLWPVWLVFYTACVVLTYMLSAYPKQLIVRKCCTGMRWRDAIEKSLSWT